MNIFKLLLTIVVKVIGEFSKGFSREGFRGAFNAVGAMLRQRRGERRVDGMPVPSPHLVDGIRMPYFSWMDEGLWPKALRRYKDFEVRPDDIFVIGYPKCGHHFLHEVLTMLLSGELKLNPKQKLSRFFEYFSNPLEHFQKMASPRVFFTHLNLKFLPKQLLEGKCKMIRCSRNPKDVIVSFYHHVTSLKHYSYSDTFTNHFRMHLDEPCEAEYGSYFRFEREYWDAFQPLVDSGVVINVTFEDLKLKPVDTIKRIGRYLALERNDEFYEMVAEETTFDKVKAAKSAEMSPFLRTGRSLWRRGVVGDWRHHLTPEMSAEVDAKMQKEWRGTPLLEFFNFGEDDGEEEVGSEGCSHVDSLNTAFCKYF